MLVERQDGLPGALAYQKKSRGCPASADPSPWSSTIQGKPKPMSSATAS